MSEHQNVEYKQSWRDEYLVAKKLINKMGNAGRGRFYILTERAQKELTKGLIG